jgi:hypothetical protein
MAGPTLARTPPFASGVARVARSWYSTSYISLTNLSTGEKLTSQFLPETLDESLEVAYELANIPGFSHQPQQFKNTGNQKYEFDLYFRIREANDANWLDQARKFLQSACYPREGADSVATGAPARLLFIWPNLITMTCILRAVAFKHSQFSPEGFSTAFTARLTLEEIRDVRLLAEDVLAFGTLRGRREDYPETLDELPPLPEEEMPATGTDEEGI